MLFPQSQETTAMLSDPDKDNPTLGSNGHGRLSYKFQRLREQIRASVLNGEFQHQLPGERELGRRYNANAKTINKALSDLSSEGLLIRRVGCGTFVASNNGGKPRENSQGRVIWLLPSRDESELPHRQRMMQAVVSRLVSERPGMRIVSSRGNDRSSRIALHAWPAAMRTATRGLLFYPFEPLSGESVGASSEVTAEAYRRHVPMVAIGGFETDAQVGAVVPDYVDAGFRLAEYLMRIGTSMVIVVSRQDAARETEMVLNGCRMAEARFRVPITILKIPAGAEPAELLQKLSIEVGGRPHTSVPHPDRRPGLICVGHRSFEAVAASGKNLGLAGSGGVEVVSLPEPGDRAAEEAGCTAYEVDAEKIAEWAARVICDTRPGDKPAEISVRGSLRIRGKERTAAFPDGQRSP